MKAGLGVCVSCDVSSSVHQNPTIADPVLQDQNVESYFAV